MAPVIPWVEAGGWKRPPRLMLGMPVDGEATVMSSRRLVLASIAIKIAALLLLALAVIYPDLGGLKAKGLGARAVGYSLGLVALPLAWRLLVRRRCVKFSWAADVLCGVPILADLLGNRLDLFDSVSWWDDAVHVVLHGLLTAGVLLQFWPRAGLASLLTATVAFGGLSGLAWELAEYATFMRHGVELSGAYRDTLGDLCGGMTGSILAGVAVALSRADLLFEEHDLEVRVGARRRLGGGHATEVSA